jgi:soluble lytic murein transglycosylase
MRHHFHRLLMLALLLAASPASATSDRALLNDFAQWENLSAPGEMIGFAEGWEFLQDHPDWPRQNTLRLNIEAAALRETPKAKVLSKFCREFPPISGRGMIACARAGIGDSAAIAKGWKQGDFTPEEEKNILAREGGKLSERDHQARLDRLLFEDKAAPARRTLVLLPEKSRPLYEARIALVTNAPDAPRKVEAVPRAQINDPGLMYNRIAWRHRKGMTEGVYELFALAPKNPPYPDLWWNLRMKYARDAFEARKYDRALRLLDTAGALKPEYLADTLWFKGWIQLEAKQNPRAAYESFYQLFRAVRTPVSKARAAYWAGRAAEKNGNFDIARNWYAKAATYPSVFYGQLAQARVTPKTPLRLPKTPSLSAKEKASFAKGDMPRLTQLLIKAGREEEADAFVLQMAQNKNDAKSLALIADFARSQGQIFDGVRVAKLALQQHIMLVEDGWPRVALPKDIPIEPALALAIIRQESEFNPHATSPAGARGLMQLMPATAKETARKLDLNFAMPRLSEPNYNITLGSDYLGRLVRGFDGSYILAIASYNAGPSNVRKWIKRFGTPPDSPEAAVNWIESIPFTETRNYVMRGLENVQMYRTLLDPQTPVQLREDLAR